MSKSIVFVRHGESGTNVKYLLSSDIGPYKLTENGIKDVVSIAEEIAKIPKISALYASPVIRTLQTAEIIGKRCDIYPKTDARLRERLMGGLNNKAFPSYEEMLDVYWKEIESGYKTGLESWHTLQQRMNSFVNSVTGKVTVAVSHSDPIMAMLGTFDPKIDDYNFVITVPTASITAVDIEKKQILCIGSKSLPETLKNE